MACQNGCMVADARECDNADTKSKLWRGARSWRLACSCRCHRPKAAPSPTPPAPAVKE